MTILYSISLLTLAAAVFPLSRLLLTPTYGELQVSAKGSNAHTTLLSFVLYQIIVDSKLPLFAPLLAWSLPLIQQSYPLPDHVLKGAGVEYVLSLIAEYTAVTLTALLISWAFLNLQTSLGLARCFKLTDARHILSAVAIFGYHFVAEKAITAFLPLHFANGHFLTSRVSLYWGVCAAITLHFPGRNALIVLVVLLSMLAFWPSYILSGRLLTSLPTEYVLQRANMVLEPHGWKILERGEGVTGYVSVLENTALDYRLLRCDHSLLGGEWLLTEQRRLREGWTNEEPVFGVFEMLEAVRLVTGVSVGHGEERALVIGLGIGTAPKALIAHGIPTTILELDPLVHAYATRYFSLPSNHTAILSDAIPWVKNAASAVSTNPLADNSAQTYTYILHDVFTGGSTPLPLFTHSFLASLRTLLDPSGGVIAINFAGDLTLPPMRNVLYTINDVFQGRCRAFRELPPLSQNESKTNENRQGDMLNLVIFCVNTPAMWPLTFREAVEADFLGSVSRRKSLMPKKEMEVALPTQADGLEVVTEGNVRKWEKEQLEAARRHWRLMRGVVPSVVWETW